MVDKILCQTPYFKPEATLSEKPPLTPYKALITLVLRALGSFSKRRFHLPIRERFLALIDPMPNPPSSMLRQFFLHLTQEIPLEPSLNLMRV